MYKLYSGLIGVLITVMIAINGVLSNHIGNYLSTVLIHLTGLICISFILFMSKIKVRLHKGIPIYLYSAGAIGVFTVLLNNISFNFLGASLTLSLGLLGQSIASVFIDHHGMLGMPINKFRKEKLLGLVLISIGIVVMTLY